MTPVVPPGQRDQRGQHDEHEWHQGEDREPLRHQFVDVADGEGDFTVLGRSLKVSGCKPEGEAAKLLRVAAVVACVWYNKHLNWLRRCKLHVQKLKMLLVRGSLF